MKTVAPKSALKATNAAASLKGALKGGNRAETPSSDSLQEVSDQSSLADYVLGPILGTGSFGRVSLVKHKSTGAMFAIKALSKAYIVKNQQERSSTEFDHQVMHVKAERDVLRMLNHPFIVRLVASFHDSGSVYFVMEFVCGGEFFRHLKSRGMLSEDAARFYAAEVLVAFEHMHTQDIIYRDLKPENLLLDSKGHIKITDLGFAKVLPNGKRTYTLCGTPDYLAPELILNKGHGKPVDWWAFGVLIFEMMAGFPPFYDDDVTNTYKKILAARFSFPSHFSANSRDLIRKLLQADLSKRFGCLAGGIADIKTHAWFKSVNWTALTNKEVDPPIKPIVKSADDHSNFDDYSALPPLQHEFELSQNEQLMFSGF